MWPFPFISSIQNSNLDNRTCLVGGILLEKTNLVKSKPRAKLKTAAPNHVLPNSISLNFSHKILNILRQNINSVNSLIFITIKIISKPIFNLTAIIKCFVTNNTYIY